MLIFTPASLFARVARPVSLLRSLFQKRVLTVSCSRYRYHHQDPGVRVSHLDASSEYIFPHNTCTPTLRKSSSHCCPLTVIVHLYYRFAYITRSPFSQCNMLLFGGIITFAFDRFTLWPCQRDRFALREVVSGIPLGAWGGRRGHTILAPVFPVYCVQHVRCLPCRFSLWLCCACCSHDTSDSELAIPRADDRQ